MKIFSSLCQIIGSIAISTTLAWTKGIEVHDAWVRLMPPGSENTAAYLRIENTTANSIRLLSASSDITQKTTIHKTMHHNHSAHMAHQDFVDIAPNSVFELKPGGYHLMLMGLTAPLKKEQVVPILLQFANAGTVTVNAKVIKQ